MIPANGTGPTSVVLDVGGVTKTYRGFVAVSDADLSLQAGRIHGLIGPNGAGKTTLLNIISGHAIPDAGQVMFLGYDVTRWRTERRAHLGMVRTFQDCRLLEDLTVAENLWLGAELARSLAGSEASEADADESTEQNVAHELLTALRLEHRLDVPVRDLSSGERKAVEVGRALSTGARLVLLDEPFSGLTRAEVEQMQVALRHLRDADCSVLLIEHNLGAVFDLCDEVTAMDRSAVVAVGSAREVRDDRRVREAFFGTDSTGDVPDLTTAADPTAGARESAAADVDVRLRVRGMRAGYGRTQILHGVDFEADAGSVVGIIGANGAGKTTLFRSIMGLATVTGGEVDLGGKRLRRLRPDRAVAAGISFCPQGRNLFPSLTVEENLRLGAGRRRDSALPVSDRVDHVLDALPDLLPFRRKAAGSLSGGQRQMLAIGRALMSEPSVLLLDEPSTGLSVGALRLVGDAIRALSDEGLAVVLAEQNLPFALELCGRGYVMEGGAILAEGDRTVLERAWELTVADADDAGDLNRLVEMEPLPGTRDDTRSG